MCIIHYWLDNWEGFVNARSASQGLGPCVCGAQSSAPVQVSEGRITQESLTFSLVSNKGKNAVD